MIRRQKATADRTAAAAAAAGAAAAAAGAEVVVLRWGFGDDGGKQTEGGERQK